MVKDNWEEEQDNTELMVDLLFESSLSINEIAKEVGWSLAKTNQKIKQLGLSWLKDSRKKMSRGQTALTDIMKKLLPGELILNEYYIDDNLRLDVYCPKYKLAAEYHGRQHFYYTARFYQNQYEFIEAQKRDVKKAEFCKKNGIALVVFRYNDQLTEESVFDRMIQAIKDSPYIKEEKAKNNIYETDFYKSVKKKKSEERKRIYRAMKEKRKNGNGNS
jgi:hypothetical protein